MKPPDPCPDKESSSDKVTPAAKPAPAIDLTWGGAKPTASTTTPSPPPDDEDGPTPADEQAGD